MGLVTNQDGDINLSGLDEQKLENCSCIIRKPSNILPQFWVIRDKDGSFLGCLNPDSFLKPRNRTDVVSVNFSQRIKNKKDFLNRVDSIRCYCCGKIMSRAQGEKFDEILRIMEHYLEEICK